MTEPGAAGRGSKPRNASTPPSGAQFAGAGIQFAATIVIFVFLGIWLDKHFGSSPWFVLVCVFVGAAAGFYSIYRSLMASTKRDANAGGPR